ncbi:MAG TPA: hypothetical protein VGK67_20350 [Myxococcales bacterium]
MPRVRLVTHEGRVVVLIDASQMEVEDARKVFLEERALVASQPKGSALTLTDVSGTPLEDSLVTTVRETVAANAPYVKAGAVVGVTGLKKMALNTINLLTSRNLRAFSTREQALAWLAQQG